MRKIWNSSSLSRGVPSAHSPLYPQYLEQWGPGQHVCGELVVQACVSSQAQSCLLQSQDTVLCLHAQAFQYPSSRDALQVPLTTGAVLPALPLGLGRFLAALLTNKFVLLSLRVLG